ncbi:MAG TPA: glucodextranase DOMON-like domain-containing protein, partial [Anaerolineae bacterium]|nr:glucodextranase DOMON-like domain-containing protein [Anaerolineae bacterium]
VMGQEGYPSLGVWRIRDVSEEPAQWRFGGAPPDSTLHTRILDVAYPAGFAVSQEEALSSFTPRVVDSGDFDGLSPDDFAQLPMVRP